MHNLFGYLKYYGDVSFDKFAFNEVDSLILSLLSYVKWDKIVPSGRNDYIYLEDACTSFLKKNEKVNFKKEDWLFPNSYKLVQELIHAKRFYHTKLYHLVSSVDSNGQFGALTIRLPNFVTYISFEGTDSNVVGWKEDFQMLYLFPIPSQKLAQEYFDKTIRFFDREIYIGGHSKGGNLAMYAYMYGKDLWKKKVKQVYNFDGPGFDNKILTSDRFTNLQKKLTVVVPEESVIGMILGCDTFKTVVSSARAVLQHDGYTWQCFGGFLEQTELSKKSKKLKSNLKEYIDDMSDQERKSFVETFFAIFERTNITNIMQLKELKISTLLGLMKEIRNIPSSTKRNLIAMLRLLITGMN